MCLSVGAVVQGFVAFDTEIRIVGVILNKVGSDRHETEVRAGIAPTGVPVLGVLRRDTRLTVPSRHLGLIPATEQREQAEQAVDAASELVHQGVDLAAFVAAAKAAPDYTAEPWDPTAELTELRALREAQRGPTTASRSAIEEQLKTIVDAALEGKRVDLNDNLFEIGASSLKLIEIHESIDKEYPGLVDLTELFDFPTIAELAQHLEGKIAANG